MYNKLFTQILDSSVWLEKHTTRIVWITLLASMDEDGFCRFATINNLAKRAIVSYQKTADAIKTLESEDQYSSDPANGGRRIERVPGGWIVLNAKKYRELASRENSRESTRKRVAAWRKQQPSTNSNAPVTPSEAYTEAVVVVSSNEETTTTPLTPQNGGQLVLVADDLPDQKLKPKRPRRSRQQIISSFSPQAKPTINAILAMWPDKQRDKSSIHIDVAMTAQRVDELLTGADRSITGEVLLEAAKLYLTEPKKFYRAPQFFFGCGNGDGPPWLAYARLYINMKEQQEMERLHG